MLRIFNFLKQSETRVKTRNKHDLHDFKYYVFLFTLFLKYNFLKKLKSEKYEFQF